MEQGPLNPFLFNRLQALYGHVKVARAGEGLLAENQSDMAGRVRCRIISPGEYYRINCPFCRLRGAADTRQRLWINHRWGIGPAFESPDALWWAAVCYNEGCLSNAAYLHQFRNEVYNTLRRNERRGLYVSAGEMPTISLGEVTNPGECTPVSELPDAHPCIQYLHSRQFDPAFVSQVYGAVYCWNSEEFPLATGRLVVPIHMRGAQVGWQGRFIGEADWWHVPKYYTRPGTNKRLMLYGLDYAIRDNCNWVVVTEGFTDVWRLGHGSVAILGKTMSYQQLELLLAYWKKVVISLDGDALDESLDVLDRLQTRLPTVVVRLPDDEDPASMPSPRYWDTVLQASIAQQVDLLCR